MKDIKFRTWDVENKSFVRRGWPKMAIYSDSTFGFPEDELYIVMQYTGIKDKNGIGQEVYEGDIIDEKGNIIGNQYETPTLLKDSTNLLIQGFGTKTWETTNKKAMDRGLAYSE